MFAKGDNMTIIGNYRIKKMISEGGFGRIYQAEHILLEERACIKQNKENSPENIELLKQEAKLLWRLNEHHSIPGAKDFFEAGDGSCVLVMSYIDGSTLEDIVKSKSRIHPEDVCWITERLLGALYYAHYNGIVHSDVKPGNVIVEPKKHDIKLIDFGLSIYKPKSGTRPIGYTEAFAAPELLQGKTPIPETDLYGAGIVLLYGLGGNPLTKEYPMDIDTRLKEYCDSLLRYDPMERLNWEKDPNPIEKLSDLRLEIFGRRHVSGK
jgi:serine/threonine protein kinase